MAEMEIDPDSHRLRLISLVKERPAIWNTASMEFKEQQKVAAAWKQICRLTWPGFDTLPADLKRTKCLDLQRQWKTLRVTFVKGIHKQTERGQERTSRLNTPYHDHLTFLSTVAASDKMPSSSRKGQPTIAHTSASASAVTTTEETTATATARAGKRPRTSADSCCSTATASPEVEEDRLFLMSLLSYMRDVPRSSKLHLRADILRLVAKYTPTPTPTHEHEHDDETRPNPNLSDVTDSPQY